MTKAHFFWLLLNLIFVPFSIVHISLPQVHVPSDKFLRLAPCTHWQQDVSMCVILVLFLGKCCLHFHADLAQTLPWSSRVRLSLTTVQRQLSGCRLCIFLHCVSFVTQGWTKMPVNCKLAYDWLGAIKFLSNHFWFRKHSAILETSNIYLCLIYFTFSFRWGNHSLSLVGTKQGPF